MMTRTWSWTWKVMLLVLFAFVLLSGMMMSLPTAVAQEIRPTPTCDPSVFCPTAVPVPSTPTPVPNTSNNNNDNNNGSIRGTLTEDRNRNGTCEAGEPPVPNVPIQFVSNDGRTTLYLQSGADGTYGLVAVGYGTWRVRAEPPAPWVVLSTNPQNVFVGSTNPVVTGINFCLSPTAPGNRPGDVVLLPTAGAAANNLPFIITFLTGFLFLLIGSFVQVQRKK
jgi:hypothetical protein